jgi:hypothetical protein
MPRSEKKIEHASPSTRCFGTKLSLKLSTFLLLAAQREIGKCAFQNCHFQQNSR